MTDRTLALALKCLEPVRRHLVVIGGTAHRMFPLHELGRDPGCELLTTEDVDLAAPLELRHDGSRELLNRLEEAGFREEVRGADYPAYTYLSPSDGSAYLQFIAPLTGSGTSRDGREDRLLRFSGICAEKLRHVDILLHRPWTVTVQSDGNDVTLQVVNPVAFLVQKLLVMRGRTARRGKDLLYVFDTLSIFADALTDLRAAATDLVQAPSATTTGRIRRAAQEFCFEESDVSREAAAISAEQRARPPDSPQIVRACQLGLRRVLASLVSDL